MRPHRVAAGLLLLLPGLPMAWALASAIGAALNLQAWRELAGDPQFTRALGMTVWTGLASTGLALAATAWVLRDGFPGPRWQAVVRWLGPMLAVPHVAFAVGLMALIAPSGWLLRLMSPWATGFEAPPPWATTQDPWGLGLIAVLAFKELPFLLWSAASQLQRGDVAHRLARELDVARSLGYRRHRAWWRVVWPQLWPRLRWPLLAVLAYSLTVVDVALVIGPTSPPTAAVLAWTWLQDADTLQNAQGAAAAWVLTALLAVSAALAWHLPRLAVWRLRWTVGTAPGRPASRPRNPLKAGASWWAVWACTYPAVMLALALGSVTGVWPFPALVPQAFTLSAWQSVAQSFATVGTTLGLALASSTLALVWAVAWLELAPSAWDAVARRFLYLPLVLPSVLWVVGLHAFALHWQLDATWTGLWLAHSLGAMPYALIAASPAYTGFDPRYWSTTASLGASRWRFLVRVKWPLLRASLASAAAVGFAVSVAQYLPTLYIGAGRFSTVTTEAVALASGAQRSLSSAYAALQWLLPVLGFALAAWVGQPRRFLRRPPPHPTPAPATP
jgi:putative thiamine transport system permease protein